jgi:hypothetical protein
MGSAGIKGTTAFPNGGEYSRMSEQSLSAKCPFGLFDTIIDDMI